MLKLENGHSMPGCLTVQSAMRLSLLRSSSHTDEISTPIACNAVCVQEKYSCKCEREICVLQRNQTWVWVCVCLYRFLHAALVAYSVILRSSLLHQGNNQWLWGSWLYAWAYFTKLWFIFTARKDSSLLEHL